MPNIDEVDHRILLEMQKDARRSNKALADAAGVSPSTMLHRIRSLEDRGVITGYHAEVHLEALSRSLEAMVFVRIQPKTPAAVEELVETIWALEETTSITLLTGPYDILVHLAVADVAALSEVVLTSIASAPNVVDEQTSIVFNHRRKKILEPLAEA